MEANASVVTQAQLNAGMGSFLPKSMNGSASSAATWSVIWFAAAVAFILTIYFGFGGLRGSVAS